MRRFLFLTLALASSTGAHAVGIDSASPHQLVPNAKAGPSMRGVNGPANAIAAARASAAAAADTGPIVHRFEYDEVGNRTKYTDAEGRVTRWETDKVGRVTARVLPGGQRETMEYNLGGRLVAKTDFVGRTTRYAHDVMGRVTSIDYPGDGDVSMTYTPMGLRSTVTDGHGTTRYTYNARDRLIGVEYPHGEAVSYEYDLALNRTALITAFQRVSYTYDARNRLETVVAAHGTTRYTYDQVGNRTSVTRPNGVRTEYGYDARNRLTRLEHRLASSGALLFGVTYTLGLDGQRLTAEERDASGIARSITWSYDTVERLIGETIVARDPTQSRATTWTYDKVGNRLTQTLTIGGNSFATTYAYDVNDRLLTETTGAAVVRYAYDANGNTRSRTSASGIVEYGYDDQDRLTEKRDANGRRTYQFDADGLRIGETYFPASGPPVTTSYVFDKSREHATIIEEFVQTGQEPRRLAATFTYGDDLIAQTRGTATHYVHADGMSSTRLLTDASATITDTYAFDAFGNEIARTGNTIVAHLYRGEQFDPNLGFYYLRARFYDPKSGRFPTMDSFEGRPTDPPSLHRYLYAHADPANALDPTGRMTLYETAVAGTVAAVLVGAAVYGAANTWRKRPAASGVGAPPALWDAVALTALTALTAQIAHSDFADPEGDYDDDEGHHTIPVYLCGAMPQEPSYISRREHDDLHRGISKVSIIKKLSEEYATKVVFGTHRSEDIVLDVATTREGRVGIANALYYFYAEGGWLPRGQRPIGMVFASERIPYESGTKTSLPWCSRNGQP